VQLRPRQEVRDLERPEVAGLLHVVADRVLVCNLPPAVVLLAVQRRISATHAIHLEAPDDVAGDGVGKANKRFLWKRVFVRRELIASFTTRRTASRSERSRLTAVRNI
jgi:hypothetical protein